MSTKFLAVTLISLITFSLVEVSFAQDAGELLRQEEEGLGPDLPEESNLSTEYLPPAIKAVEGLKVTVERFEFIGNTIVADEVLQAATQGYLNREIDFTDLQKAAADAASIYREMGLLVRVYIPEQEISGTSVKLRVVEARFGKVQMEGAGDSFKGNSQIEKWITSVQAPGNFVKPAAVNRAVLLLNDLPGVAARGNLVKGSSEFETDFALSVSKNTPYQGALSGSNDGSRSTGSDKFNVSAKLNSPFKMGDQIATTLSLSEGTSYIRTGYSFPLFYSGLTIASAVSHMEYEVIEGITSLEPMGLSDTFQLSARYPLIRHKKRNVYVSGSYNKKLFENEVLGNITSDYEVSSLQAMLTGNRFDQYFGGGMFQGSIGYVNGDVDLSGSPNEISDKATVNTQGNFNKWIFSIERRQKLIKKLAMSLSYKAQKASKNLDSSERFSIAGSNAVRAYPSGEASGSEGSLSTLTVSWKVKKYLSLSSFYDYGKITLNKDTDFETVPSNNEFSLKGAGVSAKFKAPKNISGQVTIARRDGNNPNPTFDGNDKDGTLKENRVWASLNWTF